MMRSVAGAPKAGQTPPTVRILADSAEQFVRAFAGTFRGGMFFLKNPKPLAVGRRVRVEIATRGGEPLVSGDAVVSEVVEPTEGGPANRLTFTRVARGKELLDRLVLPPGLRPAAATPPMARAPQRPEPDVPQPTIAGIRPASLAPEPAGTAAKQPELSTVPPRVESEPPARGTATMEWALPGAAPQQVVPEPPPPEPEPRMATLQGGVEDVERSYDAWDERPACFQFPELTGPRSARMIGIDLGTAFSCAAYVADGKPRVIPGEHGRRSFPSAVWIDGTRNLVGEPALDLIERDPKNVIHSWKRLLGRDVDSEAVQDALAHFAYRVEPGPSGEAAIRIGEMLCHPAWFAARVLYEIRERTLIQLSEVVESAVITVPAHYTDLQRADIREAAKIAGFTMVRLITEPVAAAIAYGVSRDEGEKTILTYDFGGGTFDASVLELDGRVFQVAATGGDPFLGGVDFDDRIMGHLLLEFFKREGINLSSDFAAMVRVAAKAERAKRELSERSEARVAIPFVAVRDGKGVTLDVTLTREKMEDLCGDLVDRTLQACDAVLGQASLSAGDLDEVVLVGGMTRAPNVFRRVEAHFGRVPRKGVHPDEAVALGAAVFADSLGRDEGLAILDVVALGVGVRAADGNSFHPVIPPRASLPVTKTHVIRADADGQTAFRADVFQGTSTLVSLCEYLGSAEVSGLPPASKGGILAEIQFRMSEDGTLALAMQDRTKSGFRRLGLRYQAAKARSRKAEPRADPRGLAYLRKLLGGR